jgi:undecaprenyl-diphosphatase
MKLGVSTWARIVAWDEAVLVRVHRWQRPLVTRTLRAFTHLGDGASLTFVGLVLLAVGTPQTHELGVLLGWSTATAALAAQVLKRVLKRSRPNSGIAGFTALVANPDAFSFPSGHTAATVALAVAWAGHGSALGLFAALFAAVVGFSRVSLGAHYPLDVMCGALLGLGSGALARLMA